MDFLGARAENMAERSLEVNLDRKMGSTSDRGQLRLRKRRVLMILVLL